MLVSLKFARPLWILKFQQSLAVFLPFLLYILVLIDHNRVTVSINHNRLELILLPSKPFLLK